MNLSLLIIIPLLTSLAILPLKGLKQVRTVSLIGAALQLILGFILLYYYWQERSAGNNTVMLFETDYAWYASLNIHYHIGVDGISIAMILLEIQGSLIANIPVQIFATDLSEFAIGKAQKY